MKPRATSTKGTDKKKAQEGEDFPTPLTDKLIEDMLPAPSRLCSFCENRAATVGKFCSKCAQLADSALDEIAGGPGELEKMLAKHLGQKGTVQ